MSSGGSKITGGDDKRTGEGEKTIEHLDKEKINAVLSRKDITGEEMNRRLKEEPEACAPPPPEFYKFVPGDDEEEEDSDEDEEECEDSDEDEDMDEEQLAREIKEAKKGIQRWFTEVVGPDPLLEFRYVFKHLDQERIKAMCTRKGITREEENKIFEEINTNIDKFVTAKREGEHGQERFRLPARRT